MHLKVMNNYYRRSTTEHLHSTYRGRYSCRTFHMRTVAWITIIKRLRYSILFFTKTNINATSDSVMIDHMQVRLILNFEHSKVKSYEHACHLVNTEVLNCQQYDNKLSLCRNQLTLYHLEKDCLKTKNIWHEKLG